MISNIFMFGIMEYKKRLAGKHSFHSSANMNENNLQYLRLILILKWLDETAAAGKLLWHWSKFGYKNPKG